MLRWEHALLKIELEESETKFSELKDVNDKLDENNEELIQENSKLEKLNAKISNDLEKEKIKLNNYKSEESRRTKEHSDLVAILEATLENKNIELKDLDAQLSKALTEIDKVKTNLEDIELRCQCCDFKASTEALLHEHAIKHEPTRKFCDLKFKEVQLWKDTYANSV